MKRHLASGEPTRRAKALGGLFGLLLGIGLFLWALEVEASSHDRASEVDICKGVNEDDCVFHGGFSLAGKALSLEDSWIFEMTQFGILFATVLVVAVGMRAGGVVVRPRERRRR
jgi:hypothetical protein